MKPVTHVSLVLASLLFTIACRQPTASQPVDQPAIATHREPPGAPSPEPFVSGTEPTATPAGLKENPSPAPDANPTTPETSVSPTNPQAVLADLYDRQQTLGICSDGFDAAVSPSGSIVYPVGDNQYLVQMMCFMAAYQGSYEYLLYDKTAGEAQVKALKLARFQEDENGQIALLEEQQVGGLPEYEPGRQQLTLLTKFTGAGTCGALATYQLQGGQFQLVAYRAKFDCDENFVDPSEYPQVFP